jgi:hypothetical protein
LEFRPNLNLDGFEEDKLKTVIYENSLKITKGLLSDDKQKYFFETANSSLSSFLQDILRDNEQMPVSDEIKVNTEIFIKLQCEILNWAVRHNLRKDWVLVYAYFFISEFSKKPDAKVSDIQVGFLQRRDLAAPPFEFKFKGWLAGDEKREDYEQKLREHFEGNLEQYFHSVSNLLELNKKTGITKPIDYDCVKPLVRWTVQEWSIEKIVEMDFGILDNLEMKKKFDNKVRYFEEELPKFEKYHLPFRKPCGKSLSKK